MLLLLLSRLLVLVLSVSGNSCCSLTRNTHMLNITFWKGYTVWTRTLCLLATCPRLFSIFLLFKSVPGSQGLSPFGACGSSVKFLIPTIVVYNIFQEGLKITVVD